jgi:hypothetical protein
MARRAIYVLAGVALAFGCWVSWTSRHSNSRETIFQPVTRQLEPAPMCPWRAPESDLRTFFPEATGYQTEIRILSGKRLELQERLGRPLQPEENSLYVHQVYREQQRLGSVLTRRLKGEYGAIELVLAIDAGAIVRGVRLQRLREPETVSQVLEDPTWLGSFSGKSVSAKWQLGQAVPDLPEVARASGQAIVEGVRSLLVLLSTSEEGKGAGRHH